MGNLEQGSSETFAIGEIVLVIGALFHPEHVGQDAEIIEGLAYRWSDKMQKQILCYRIRMLDGRTFRALPENLKKKRPPRKDLEVVRWADCPWQPEVLRV